MRHNHKYSKGQYIIDTAGQEIMEILDPNRYSIGGSPKYNVMLFHAIEVADQIGDHFAIDEETIDEYCFIVTDDMERVKKEMIKWELKR